MKLNFFSIFAVMVSFTIAQNAMSREPQIYELINLGNGVEADYFYSVDDKKLDHGHLTKFINESKHKDINFKGQKIENIYCGYSFSNNRSYGNIGEQRITIFSLDKDGNEIQTNILDEDAYDIFGSSEFSLKQSAASGFDQFCTPELVQAAIDNYLYPKAAEKGVIARFLERFSPPKALSIEVDEGGRKPELHFVGYQYIPDAKPARSR